jgi:hypothetical protein
VQRVNGLRDVALRGSRNPKEHMVGLALVIGLCVVFEVVESWRRAVSCVLYSELERVGVMELVH